jgi:hypothetical protein
MEVGKALDTAPARLWRRLRFARMGDIAKTAKAGTAGPPPVQVKGYLIAEDPGGTPIKIPYYDV